MAFLRATRLVCVNKVEMGTIIRLKSLLEEDGELFE